MHKPTELQIIAYDFLDNMRKNQSCPSIKENKIFQDIYQLEELLTGRADCLFCNAFLSEMIQLIYNSLNLYANGYFDAAFYSARQANELANNMLYLAENQEKLDAWKAKLYFPTNHKVVDELDNFDTAFKELKTHFATLFTEQKNILKTINKIIHKQGFDTFYKIRSIDLRKQSSAGKENETNTFIRLIKITIKIILLYFIILDPLCLIRICQELTMRMHFEPMTSPLPEKIFFSYFTLEELEIIKKTDFFSITAKYFQSQDKLSAATYDVIHNDFFDIEKLNEIKLQNDILTLDARIILEILDIDTLIFRFYTEFNFFPYRTSYAPMVREFYWSSEDNFLNQPTNYNVKIDTYYYSITEGLSSNWKLEHKHELTNKQIENICKIFKKYRTTYRELIVNFKK